MAYTLLMQFIALSAFAFFAGFCFCDGFNLHVLKKIFWFAVFFLIAYYILKTKGEFDLALILPIPTLLAILLCYRQKKGRVS